MLAENPKFSGAVLAGGRSSRFGQDKALYVYEGKPLAMWALGSLTGADERFLVSSRPYDLGVSVHADLYPGSSLGGLHTALFYAAHPWVAVAACDMPFLTADYWQRLLTHTEGVQAVVVRGPDGRLEPLAALYHKSLSASAEAQLQKGKFKVQALLETAQTCVVPWETLGLDAQTFVNANRLTDL